MDSLIINFIYETAVHIKQVCSSIFTFFNSKETQQNPAKNTIIQKTNFCNSHFLYKRYWRDSVVKTQLNYLLFLCVIMLTSLFRKVTNPSKIMRIIPKIWTRGRRTVKHSFCRLSARLLASFQE